MIGRVFQRVFFNADNEEYSDYYPWECPYCNMAMAQETREDLVVQGIFNYCPGCGEELE